VAFSERKSSGGGNGVGTTIISRRRARASGKRSTARR
jgi:hypothetical protein